MRPVSVFARQAAAAALLAAALLPAAVPSPARADRLRERAEADSFGNLVVWSRSGYKRIVVGGAYRADAYPAAPDIVDGERPAIRRDRPGNRHDAPLDPGAYEGQYDEGAYDGASGGRFYAEGGDAVRRERERRVGSADPGDCYRAPAFVKGRSYMYGLAEGEMPVITPCARFED